MAQKYNIQQNGFTIVEMVVVIVVLGILMSLAIINVMNSQVTARDTEREEDVQAIARHFESLYDESINPYTGDSYASYPGQVQAALAAPEIVEGVDRNIFFAPNVPVTDNYSNMSLIGATNTDETTTGVTPQPGAGNDVYVYQSLTPDNTTCGFTADSEDHCIRFNLFYWNEANNEVRKITSRHQ